MREYGLQVMNLDLCYERIRLISYVPWNMRRLGTVHKCQHFHECTNNTLSGGGEVCENQDFMYTFNFLAWFLFSWRFLVLKKVDVRGVSESVWFVHSWKYWHLWMAPYDPWYVREYSLLLMTLDLLYIAIPFILVLDCTKFPKCSEVELPFTVRMTVLKVKTFNNMNISCNASLG